MDLSQIFAVLTQADQQAQANSPYSGFENVSNQFAPVFGKLAASGDYGLGETLGGSFLNGMFGGAMHGLNQDWTANQNQMAQDTLFKLWGGKDAARPDGMDAGVYNKVSGYGKLFSAQRDMENQQLDQKANRDFELEIAKTMVSEAVKNPYSTQSQQILQKYSTQSQQILQKYGFGGGEVPQPMTEPSAARSLSSPMAQPPATPGSGDFGANPLDLGTYLNADSRALSAQSQMPGFAPSAPQPAAKTMEDYLRQYQGNSSVAEAAMKRDMEAPDRYLSIEDSIRTQFLAQKPVQDFMEISKQFAVLQSAEKDKSIISDLDYAYSIARILDPNSVVRESEAGMVIDSQAIVPGTLARINSMLTGDPALRPQIRSELLDLAQRHYETQKGVVDALSNGFKSIVQERGGNPDRAIIIPQAMVQPRQMGSLPSDSGAGGGDRQAAALKELAKQYPPTLEGRVAFKDAAAKLMGGNGTP